MTTTRFQFHTPHAISRPGNDGVARRVAVTVPAEFPSRLIAAGRTFRYLRQGYRADGTPAGYYTAGPGADLWYCDGVGHLAGAAR